MQSLLDYYDYWAIKTLYLYNNVNKMFENFVYNCKLVNVYICILKKINERRRY